MQKPSTLPCLLGGWCHICDPMSFSFKLSQEVKITWMQKVHFFSTEQQCGLIFFFSKNTTILLRMLRCKKKDR